MSKAKNTVGETLERSSDSSLIGYARSGSCEREPNDLGSYPIYTQVQEEFPGYSKSKGNDMITPFRVAEVPACLQTTSHFSAGTRARNRLALNQDRNWSRGSGASLPNSSRVCCARKGKVSPMGR